MIGIYKIQNKINGKCYIGQSLDIKKRLQCHKSVAFREKDSCYNYPLYRAIRKYGLDNFTFDILEKCKPEDLNNREVYWVKVFNSCLNGYNQTFGGDTSGPKTRKITEKQYWSIVRLLKTTTIPITSIADVFSVGIDTVSEINNGKTRVHKNIKYPIRANSRKIKKCIDCGIEIDRKATRCSVCDKKRKRKTCRPERETLIELLKDRSYCSVAKMFGVSDNAIRKWLRTQ